MKDKLHPIEAIEAQGQSDFIVSEHLPVYAPWDELHTMGIKELEDHNEVAASGKLFCKVALPPGWKRVATDHSMWTDLVDEKGVKRASIFYKAAPYDKRAYLRIER